MATQANSEPIVPFRLLNVNAVQAPMMRISEKALNTQKIGCPCFVTSGYLAERTAIDDGTDLIAGFTVEAAHNLASDGVGAELTFGSVQNQSAARNIPVGAPISDGTLGFYVANDQVWFKGKTDDAATLAQTHVGVLYGLTKGSNGFWFVDTSITAVNSGACVEIVELIDPIGTVGGRVAFKVMSVRQQFGGA